MKKIAISLAAFGSALAVLPMFAAFEAHVINVTARIENALQVSTDAIDFGTVFPQEYLEKDLHIQLSGSFRDETRVDDVEYIIRQKPKCAWISADGREMWGPTMSGHVNDDGRIECPDESDRPTVVPDTATWGPLPLLCPYLSKHKADSDPDLNQALIEKEIDAFHQPWDTSSGSVVWNDAIGRLAKSDDDIEDWWIIDLAVPCFGDHCAQDWATFVGTHNPAEEDNADSWTLDKDLEHRVFGCDLWVEVTGVSVFPTPEQS